VKAIELDPNNQLAYYNLGVVNASFLVLLGALLGPARTASAHPPLQGAQYTNFLHLCVSSGPQASIIVVSPTAAGCPAGYSRSSPPPKAVSDTRL
jgi:hypothetical protein